MTAYEKKIRRKLFEKEMSIAEFAKALGVTRQTAYHLLKRQASLKLFIRAARVLRMDPKELVFPK